MFSIHKTMEERRHNRETVVGTVHSNGVRSDDVSYRIVPLKVDKNSK